jgi:hypothetical protein
MSAWIVGLGTVSPCAPCATLDISDLALSTNLGWISDQTLLGAELSQSLQNIYANRTPQASPFYVSLVQGVGDPSLTAMTTGDPSATELADKGRNGWCWSPSMKIRPYHLREQKQFGERLSSLGTLSPTPWDLPLSRQNGCSLWGGWWCRPAIPAAGSALGSRPCGALSSAQVRPSINRVARRMTTQLEKLLPKVSSVR